MKEAMEWYELPGWFWCIITLLSVVCIYLSVLVMPCTTGTETDRAFEFLSCFLVAVGIDGILVSAAMFHEKYRIRRGLRPWSEMAYDDFKY